MPLAWPSTKACGLSFSVANVSKTFKRVNTRKAARPQSMRRLAGWCVYGHIQSIPIQSVVPTCFKMATIVPVPKKAKVTELNDYRPIALTSVIMKCFERLVKDDITS